VFKEWQMVAAGIQPVWLLRQVGGCLGHWNWEAAETEWIKNMEIEIAYNKDVNITTHLFNTTQFYYSWIKNAFVIIKP
jgi:hypothetical protein